ncbi:MAG: hypothetical protein WCP04_08130 [Pseudomonadota bacterium]|jgi:hypothetical protein
MNNPTEARFNADDLYREDVYTDRQVGTLRALTPVTTSGAPDPTRQTLYVGQISVVTPMGTLPISFEVDGAETLAAAIEGFSAGAQKAMDDTMRELQQLRREAGSQIVIPEAGGGGLGGGGRIRMP